MFAQAFDLTVRRVVVAPVGDEAEIPELQLVQDDVGTMINSGFLDGLPIHQATVKIMDHLEEKGWGERVTTYRLRDWLVSRQRYWGAPIPIIHCQTCGAVPVPEEQLPIVLPTDVDFRPTGESPIARSKSFHQGVTCPKCSEPARRESDTLDTFVDSSWYFLRFIDPHNEESAFSEEAIQAWMPVDRYVGGVEHAVLHLLYARFITKALADAGGFSFREPFLSLRNQGFILAEDGRKMSKSLGNVVSPDDVVAQYGADTLRAYEMFMGPFTDTMPWSTRSMVGTRRWLDRVWSLHERIETKVDDSEEAIRAVEQAVQKVTADIENFRFNTAISTLMETSNALQSQPLLSQSLFHRYLQLLAPFAPHLAAELWEMTGGEGSIEQAAWPVVDASKLETDHVTLVVQVNGRVRATLVVARGLAEADAMRAALEQAGVSKHVPSGTPGKIVYVPDRILNIVTGD
ncbi:class I tRNA ligase family protein [Candidatus Berkelbacteria bacterium]|nr:class I tRNA ligase family protein [Candidatus Berkelbacteria bacterium]